MAMGSQRSDCQGTSSPTQDLFFLIVCPVPGGALADCLMGPEISS